MKKFETPVVNVMKFEVEDVIATSFNGEAGDMPVMPMND